MKNVISPLRLLIISTFFMAMTSTVCLAVLGPHDLYIGPEVYYLKRQKEGGSHQSGWLFGGHATYERRPLSGFYWAADGYYAYGRIDGSTASGKTLRSDLTDRSIEGRLGYSFCLSPIPSLNLTPYGGYGYFCSTNDFIDPSPLTCRYKNHFNYGTAGLKLSYAKSDCLDIGLDLQAMYSNEAKSDVSDDPDFENFTLIINDEWQYRVEIPIKYQACCSQRIIDFRFTPFYRFRHFGGQENYPFDFIDTQFNIYGAHLTVRVLF